MWYRERDYAILRLKDIVKAPSRFSPTTIGKDRFQSDGDYNPNNKPCSYHNGFHLNTLIVAKRNDKQKRRAKNKIARKQRKK